MTAYLLAALFAPLSFAFNVFVYVTAPLWAFVAALFKLTALPWPLSWVHTHDDDIFGSKTTKEPIPATFFARFKASVWWLWRNPGYGFDAYVLGYPADDVLDVSSIGKGKFGGNELAWQKHTLLLTNGRRRFSFKADIPLIAGRYLKFWIGWHYVPQAGRHIFKFDANPLKRVRTPHIERN